MSISGEKQRNHQETLAQLSPSSTFQTNQGFALSQAP